MKKRKSIKSKASSALFLLFCLFGETLSLWLYWNDLNSSFSHSDALQIATVTFKHRVAQRKFMDRLVWDRLQQNGPLYNGDTVRTAPGSEAVIVFNDNVVIELEETSIAQIFLTDTGGTSVDFAGGGIFVDSSAAENAVTLKSGGASVKLDAGGSMSAAAGKQDSGLSVKMIEGSGVLSSGGGTTAVNGGESLSVTSGGSVEKSLVTVTAPKPGERILNFSDGGTVPVTFRWTESEFPENSSLVLETAEDKDFSSVLSSQSFASGNSASLEMADGTTFWRTYISSGGKTVPGGENSGRISVLPAKKPEPVVPAENDTFFYRKKTPVLRFVWNGDEYTQYYIFEVADNLLMSSPVISVRTSRTSNIVSTLDEGTWYWRVTPVYPSVVTGTAAPSDVFSFNIKKRGELKAPSLRMPSANGFVDVSASAESRRTVFSWDNSPEAVSYTFCLSGGTPESEPIVSENISENYFPLDLNRTALDEGLYWWWVYQTDSEGTDSPISEKRQFVGIEGEVMFRTVFPPEGYSFAESFMYDTKFTWKNNVPGGLVFQIARDSGFRNVVFSERYDSSKTGQSGMTLAPGTYWWRIVSGISGDGSGRLESEPKKFSVVPPLDAPRVTVPSVNSKVVIRPETPVRFEWLPVEGADYYQAVITPSGNTGKEIYRNNMISDSGFEFDFLDVPNGFYRLSVQGAAVENEMSTRRSGFISDVIFEVRQVRPVTLVSPARGADFDGITAFTDPASLEWKLPEIPAAEEIVVARSLKAVPDEYGGISGDGGNIVVRQKVTGSVFRLPRLREGTYYWNVLAKTTDDIDISSLMRRYFTVQEMEKLAAVGFMKPEDGFVFDIKYLKNSLAAEFSWPQVPDADSYNFVLARVLPDGGNEVIFADNLRKNSYRIDSLSVLDEGEFFWSVEPVQHFGDNEILRYGEKTSAEFRIELPEIETQVKKWSGERYGN